MSDKIKNVAHLRVKVKYYCEDPPDDHAHNYLRPADIAKILNNTIRSGDGEAVLFENDIIWGLNFEYKTHNWADYGFHIQTKQETDTGVYQYRAFRCEDWNPQEQGWPPPSIPSSEWLESEEIAIRNLMDKIIQSEAEEQ